MIKLKLGSDPARPHDTPAAHGFKQTKPAGNDQYHCRPNIVSANDYAGEDEQSAEKAAHEPTARINIPRKEFLHDA